MSLFTVGSARAVLVLALVYSFPDVFNVIYIYRILLNFNVLNWHWSPLTQTSLLLSPSDGLASFLKTTQANGIKVVKKVITSKFRFHLIAIYALGCFRNFSCTPVPTKITLKSPPNVYIYIFHLKSQSFKITHSWGQFFSDFNSLIKFVSRKANIYLNIVSVTHISPQLLYSKPFIPDAGSCAQTYKTRDWK